MYSVNVYFERKIQVDDDFVLSNDKNLTDAFKEISERFPEENLNDLDGDTNCDCSEYYFDQDPLKLDSIEIIHFGNQLITSQFIKK